MARLQHLKPEKERGARDDRTRLSSNTATLEPRQPDMGKTYSYDSMVRNKTAPSAMAPTFMQPMGVPAVDRFGGVSVVISRDRIDETIQRNTEIMLESGVVDDRKVLPSGNKYTASAVSISADAPDIFRVPHVPVRTPLNLAL